MSSHAVVAIMEQLIWQNLKKVPKDKKNLDDLIIRSVVSCINNRRT